MVRIGVVDVSPNDHHDRDLQPYLDGVRMAGGEPFVMAWTTDEELLSQYVRQGDGFLLSGGGDIHPSLYGEALLPECGKTRAPRDAFERLLLQKLLPTQKPILGICRGLQILNVMCEGTLYQDLPSQNPSPVEHRPMPPERIFESVHDVRLEPDSLLASILQCTSLSVNSMHHQAVKRLGTGLRAIAHTEDGLVEGAQLLHHPFCLAVQWHPECLLPREDALALFQALIDAAKERKNANES